MEHVLQGYAIPLAVFAAEDPAFNPNRVSSFRLVVDRSTGGSIWVAEVGLSGA